METEDIFTNIKYFVLKFYRQSRIEYQKRKFRGLSQTVKSLAKRKHRDCLSKIKNLSYPTSEAFRSYDKNISACDSMT